MLAKVVHIITKMELGGAQQNTLHTVTQLDGDDFQVWLLAGPGGELFDRARTFKRFLLAPDLIREVRPWRDVRAFFQILKLLERIQAAPPAGLPVIVHTHSSKAGILGRLAAALAGMPVIIHSIHGYGFHDGQHPAVRRLYILLERLCARFTNGFIAVSQANIETGISLNIFSRERVRLIRSGIDIGQFSSPAVPRSEMRRRLGIPEGVPVALMVSCLKPQKAPVDFVRVCGRVAERFPQARFLLAGDGELRGCVENAVRACGLQTQFHLLGWQQDVASLLHAADVLVLTSRWEGLPRVLPQAMSAGLPCVVTRVDGSPEAVRQQETGFVLEPGDIAGMAKKIMYLFENSSAAEKLGAAGKLLVGEFDERTMIGAQDRLYRDFLPGLRSCEVDNMLFNA